MTRKMYVSRVKNSDQITVPLTSPAIRAFATGYRSDDDSPCVQLAWTIENVALMMGWPEGRSLGSEVDLAERFNVNRDVLRSALRLVEARGAMRVERGRCGGLRLVRPSSHGVASALASYLDAWGYRPASQEILPTLKRGLASIDHGSRFADLIVGTELILSDDLVDDPTTRTRAEIVAMRLIKDVSKPIPVEGVSLGCEADLCDRFGLAHRTFRQSIAILQDLGMLSVNRGRGGGYLLRRPSKIGISRRLFAWILADRLSPAAAVQILLGINHIKLRFACANLARLDETDRNAWCDRLYVQIEGAAEPERWVLMQKALSNCANDLMINTIISGLLAYIARLNFNPDHTAYDKTLFDAETRLIEALRTADYGVAAAALEEGQDCMMRVARTKGSTSEHLAVALKQYVAA